MVTQGSYFQYSTEYDCASMLQLGPGGSFSIEATFEHADAGAGAGFIFSSRDRDGISFSQMVRFDGPTILLAGYFQNGEFTATSSVHTPDVSTRRHTLRLDVDASAESYAVSVDDSVVISTAELLYPNGSVGVQSSGGKVAFHEVKIWKRKPGNEPARLDWPGHFAITSTNEFILPNEHASSVEVRSTDGSVIRRIGTPAARKGQLHKPTAAALLDDSTVAIADKGSKKIQLYTLGGRWLASIGGPGTTAALFDEPVGLAANSLRQLFVLEKNNARVQVFDENLRHLLTFGKGILREPLDIAVAGDRIYVANTGLGQIDVFRWNGTKETWQRSISYGGGEARGIAVSGAKIYLSVVNQVRCYDTTGTLLNTFIGRAIDFILPQGLAIDRSGGVWIADYFGGRIVNTSADLRDPTPLFRQLDSTRVLAGWGDSASAVKELELVRRGGTDVRRFRSASGPVLLEGLDPGTTYRAKMNVPLTIIPHRAKLSRAYPFTTMARRHQKQFSRLPMIALLFTNVFEDRGDSSLPLLADDEIDRIKHQILDGVQFYWIHSGMRLFLDVDFLVVREPLHRSKVYGDEWWYPPRESTLSRVLQENHLDLRGYGGVFYVTCTQRYDTTARRYVLSGKGGGFTNGIGTGKGYGISWWEATRRDHDAGNNWLMVHEFNHQLDDIFLANGYPEYWFNHISPTIGTAAAFGEHFDANAHILRMVPSAEWLDLSPAIVSATTDRDEDEIPDHDPRLPLDELRLGTDTLTSDSDGDGLDDPEELYGSNWISEGWGESAGQALITHGARTPDRDNDGVSDHDDPLPGFAIETMIAAGTDTKLGMIRNEYLEAEAWTRWEKDTLMVALKSSRKAPAKIMLDLHNDGWFCGRENVLATTSGNSGDAPAVKIFNGSRPREWPFMDNTLAESLRIDHSEYQSEGKVVTQLLFTNLDGLGVTLEDGRKVGLSIGWKVELRESGMKRFLMLYEPNRFFPLTLTK